MKYSDKSCSDHLAQGLTFVIEQFNPMTKLYPALVILLASCISSTTPIKRNSNPEIQVSAEELKLYELIMDYRKERGLPKIPLSKSLTYVAQQHCLDLSANSINERDGCNMHSWSGNGKWSKCCYTPDHKQAKCMWNKPRELTGYEGNGYEIAFGSSDRRYISTAEGALAGWKSSKGHNNVIVNREKWKNIKWKAIGVGMYKGYAMVWFGEEVDVEGKPNISIIQI